jgi:integrase
MNMDKTGIPHYGKRGKRSKLLGLEEYISIAETIPDQDRQAFTALLYYTGVRVGELLRAFKEQFKVDDGLLVFDVGPREKTKRLTSPLVIPLSAPLMQGVLFTIQHTRKGKRVFDFDRSTAWRLMNQYFQAYPHFFRLNRITQFAIAGFSLPEIISWSGHKNVSGLDPYIGQANVKKMGQSLGA